jgi:hypothetical protein
MDGNVKAPSSNEIQITNFKSKYSAINTFVIHLKFGIWNFNDPYG